MSNKQLKVCYRCFNNNLFDNAKFPRHDYLGNIEGDICSKCIEQAKIELKAKKELYKANISIINKTTINLNTPNTSKNDY